MCNVNILTKAGKRFVVILLDDVVYFPLMQADLALDDGLDGLQLGLPQAKGMDEVPAGIYDFVIFVYL